MAVLGMDVKLPRARQGNGRATVCHAREQMLSPYGDDQCDQEADTIGHPMSCLCEQQARACQVLRHGNSNDVCPQHSDSKLLCPEA